MMGSTNISLETSLGINRIEAVQELKNGAWVHWFIRLVSSCKRRKIDIKV